MVSGSLGTNQVQQGRLRGDQITFNVGGTTYTGTVSGTSMKLAANGQSITATKKS
jgi:hypothetical protein